MSQLGHTSAALALEVYARVIEEGRGDTGERMDALVRPPEWAVAGSNGAEADEFASVLATENPA